jgi:hypothetical protein
LLHCACPAEHTSQTPAPWQPIVHGVPFWNWPLTHETGVFPLQNGGFAAAVQTSQTPAWQPSEQGVPPCQVPSEPQVSGVLPLQLVCPGAQLPVHPPFTQV